MKKVRITRIMPWDTTREEFVDYWGGTKEQKFVQFQNGEDSLLVVYGRRLKDILVQGGIEEGVEAALKELKNILVETNNSDIDLILYHCGPMPTYPFEDPMRKFFKGIDELALSLGAKSKKYSISGEMNFSREEVETIVSTWNRV